MRSALQHHRNITPAVIDALADTPVVVIHGARQTGKSTLARSIAEGPHPATYMSFDDLTILGMAKDDPAGFIAGLTGPVVIDEIQRVPDLLLAIKASVDRDRRPGRFLLTGSAHVLNRPRLADTLAGRMEVLTLWPLSQGELHSTKETFIDRLFASGPLSPVAQPKVSPASMLDRIVQGGFPEATARTNPDRRRAWFGAYISAVIEREVRDLSNIAGLTELPRLLSLLAARAAGLLNYADLARDAGLNQITLKRYVALLNAVFMTINVRPWFANRAKRLMKSEKVYLVDTGLLAHLLNVTHEDIAQDAHAKGALFENFVAVEILKQRTWSATRPDVYHFRDYSGNEVDLVLEAPGGRKVVGIEVKASATIRKRDLTGMMVMREALRNKFHRGVVLYNGDTIVPFGNDIYAVPIQHLWANGASAKKK
ncbi:MAG: ATP-binding protein [Candidatus Hydrogenedentes bacterium]|nr:ATP-binding protein [Candidatus Hydrogenedentota bacterium]